jgi:hypothetical protein
MRFALSGNSLVPCEPAQEGVERQERFSLSSPLTVGLAAGSWCAFGEEGELPRDQREDDGKSLVFDSDPLEEAVEILGEPTLSVRISSDRPGGFLAARLNDVSPDGASTRVSYGLLNLTHREGHDTARALEPGKEYDVVVRLNHVAHSFAPEHRIRLALSTSYWPIAWPSAANVVFELASNGSSFELPVRPRRATDDLLKPFLPAESAAEARTTDLDVVGATRSLTRDLTTNEILYTVASDVTESGAPAMTRIEETGVEHGHAVIERFRIADGEPLSARAEVVHEVVFRSDTWAARVETRTRLSATESSFRIGADLEAFDGSECVFSRSWDRSVPRNGV